MFKNIAIIAGALSLVGCANLSNEQQGAIIGATAGGILGNQVGGGSGRVIATAAGVLVGGIVGSNLGRMMDEQDRRNTAKVLETVRTNETAKWQNPDTGYEYRVTPRSTTLQSNGQPCREFTTTATIGGKIQQIYGYACRQPDGSWKIVDK